MTTPRPTFERGTGFLLSRLGTLAARDWNELLQDHELTLLQYVALVVLDEQGPQRQARLAQLVAIDPRNLVSIVDGLGDRRLVARTVDPADRRGRTVSITSAGRKALARVAAAASRQRGDFLGALTATEQRQLNHLLQRLYDAHTEEPPAP